MRGLLSMISITVYVSLFSSQCGGAAVDAPKASMNTIVTSDDHINTDTDNVATKAESHINEEEGDSSSSLSQSHSRPVRSVPVPDTVLNFLPQQPDSDSDPTWQTRDKGLMTRERVSPQKQQHHPSYLNQWPSESRDSWQLEPQVGKRARTGSKRALKRGGGGQSYYGAEELQMLSDNLDAVERGAATTMLSRQQRNGRRYDVPQIECPRSPDHMERFACPRPDRRGRFRCIDDRALCDGFYDCPDKEDENPDHCLFYKTTKAHLDILAEALLRWARGR